MGQYSISNGHDAEHVGLELTHYSFNAKREKDGCCQVIHSARKTRDVPSLLQDHLDASAGVVHQNVDATPDSDGLVDLGVDNVLRVGDVELHEIEPRRVGERTKVLDLLDDSGGRNDLLAPVECRPDQSSAHARGGAGDEPDLGVGVLVRDIVTYGHCSRVSLGVKKMSWVG